MIYSSWQPDRGGYVYYETSQRHGISDDLPIPSLPQSSPIGVASTSVGRPLPLGAKIVGFGPLPRGSIIPLDRTGLSGLVSGDAPSTLALLGIGLASAAVGVFLSRRLGQ